MLSLSQWQLRLSSKSIYSQEDAVGRHRREASVWLNIREERYYENSIWLIAGVFSLGLIFLTLEVINSSIILWKAIIIFFFLFILDTLFLLIFAHISERRIDRYSESNPYFEFLVRKDMLPGFYVLLRDLEEFSLLRKVFPLEDFSTSELEIIDCLVKDGSELSLRELTFLAKNLA